MLSVVLPLIEPDPGSSVDVGSAFDLDVPSLYQSDITVINIFVIASSVTSQRTQYLPRSLRSSSDGDKHTNTTAARPRVQFQFRFWFDVLFTTPTCLMQLWEDGRASDTQEYRRT